MEYSFLVVIILLGFIMYLALRLNNEKEKRHEAENKLWAFGMVKDMKKELLKELKDYLEKKE